MNRTWWAYNHSEPIIILRLKSHERYKQTSIEGFWDYSQVQPKHKNAIKRSGGIIILARCNIRPGLKLIENSEGFLWFYLKKSYFKLKNDVYLCGVYIPPAITTANITSKTDYILAILKNQSWNTKIKEIS